MNFFEQELRKLAALCDGITNPVFAGRVCYADLGGDNRVKFQFVKMGYGDPYDALKATILNRTEGEIDNLVFRFSDVWGMKNVGDLSYDGEIVPHILAQLTESDWFAYHPNKEDYKQLAAEVSVYLSVFSDRSFTHQKAQEQKPTEGTLDKKLRDAKEKAKTQQSATGQNKSKPDKQGRN